MVARFDRAGFAVLHENSPSTSDIAAVVARIGDALTEPNRVNDLGLGVTASIGVVQSPPHRADAVELLHAADLALRYALRKGPGQWAQLAPGEDATDRRLFRLAAIMPGAWDAGQLEVGYRLRVRLTDDRPVGVHATIRWREADPGYRCVDLAEQTGLSPRLGRWLLRSAGDQLRSWRRRSGTDLALAISLSPNHSAAPDLVDTVLGMLDDTELPSERLQVAMPADEVCHGRAQAVENLTSLAAAGVETAVHDFGGGSADLLQLADLPLHAVWLTPELMHRARGAGRDSLAATTITELIRLTHLAGLTVAVEDVRSRAEANWWRWAGADTATGPLYSPPDEPTTIDALLAGD